jgi:hypothetical protein
MSEAVCQLRFFKDGMMMKFINCIKEMKGKKGKERLHY